MDTARIAELLAPFLPGPPAARLARPDVEQPVLAQSVLKQSVLEQIQAYLDLLLRWNRRLALTAVRDEENIVIRHFGESLFAASHWLLPSSAMDPDVPRGTVSGQRSDSLPGSQFPLPDFGVPRGTSPSDSISRPLSPVPDFANSVPGSQFPAPGPSVPRGTSSIPYSPFPIPWVLDVGSGAGFPGIPLKLYAPMIHLTLVEAHGKKATFLREVVRTLRLTDVTVLNRRVEELLTDLSAPNQSHHSADVPRGTLPTDSVPGSRFPFPVAAVPRGTLAPDSFPYSQFPIPWSLVTLRAVEQFSSILPIAARLVATGGRLGLLIGASQVEVARNLLSEWIWDVPVSIPGSTSRVILTGTRPAMT